MTETTTTMTRVMVDLPGGPIEVVTEESGVGPVVLLTHPNPGSRHDYDAIWPTLTQTFRTIRFDWPGYGDSPPAPHVASAIGFSDVLAALVTALQLDSFSIVGNSVGGFAAASFAHNHPERVSALVLISPGGFTAANPLTRTFCRLIGTKPVGPIAMRLMPRMYLRVTNEWTTAIRARAIDGASRDGELSTFRSLWRSFADKTHDLRTVAPKITTPTLMVWGKRDPVLRWRSDGKRAARLLKPALTTAPAVMPSGHQPYAEVPEVFLASLIPFLLQHAGPRTEQP